ncbi:hypothetical protein SEUCBS139899_007445 [Sporothrix eucalyptigena]|uniref:Peptidase A1 domain-containing protein n=1 Tax=Sporothrix eucalyptigena TaxID=1812306 RepID=A0ABP0B9T1_9PEZI
MRSVFSVICLLGLVVTFVWAAPAPNTIQKRSFKIERVRNTAFTGHNTPRQLLKAHMKFGIRPPQGLIDHINAQEAARQDATAVSKKKGHKHGNGNGNGNGNANANNGGGATTDAGTNTTGTTTATTTNTTVDATTGSGVGIVTNTPTSGDVEYLSPVTIGGQTLNMDFDTGSSDLWVFNTDLSTAQSQGHTLFDPNQSSTFKKLNGATFSITYGDGSAVQGTVGTDQVNIGGAVVNTQAVELATKVSSSFVQDTSSNGLVGLAFSKLNTVQPTQQKTFFDNVQDSLTEPVMTANLRHDAAGSYEFGAIDSTQFTGTMTFVDVNTTQGFWQFSSSKFAIGNGTVQTGGAGQAIADTGTTLLLANDNIVNAYYSTVTGAEDNQEVGGITIPCDADLPDLQLEVGGSLATVKGSDIMFEQVQGNTCYGGLQAIDSDLMIFGDVFFKSNFIAFNIGNNTLGFAQHA